jgi:hypothetical protein
MLKKMLQMIKSEGTSQYRVRGQEPGFQFQIYDINDEPAEEHYSQLTSSSRVPQAF